MAYSFGFLIIGILITVIGAILVLFSLQAQPEDLKSRNTGIIFIGPIPIIISGNRKWIITILGISIIVFIIMNNRI
jgi:uncharacterized membrane protein